MSVSAGAVALRSGERSSVLHPLWLRERSREPGDVDALTSQRFYGPHDVPLDLAVVQCDLVGDILTVMFSDESSVRLDVPALVRDLGWEANPEAAPEPVLWDTAPDAWPAVDWQVLLHDREARATALRALFELGFVIVQGAARVDGAVRDIAACFGRISPTSYGDVFDVLSEPNAVDLSNTSVALGAHADMPYRRPVPGLQLLHALANEAPGGDSTLVDGFAAAEALRGCDPHGYETLCSLGIEFRYDIGTNAMMNTAPMFERDHAGKLRCVRFSPRIDYAPNADHATLDSFYRARRSFAEWVNSAAHRATFRLQPGDVMVFDNHRILHGRTAFDPTRGRRHLQGCYLDHDGLHTQWQLLHRDTGLVSAEEESR